MLAEGLVAMLAGNGSITAIVGSPTQRQELDREGRSTNGIFPVQLPEGTPLPAIAYSDIHQADEMTMDGPSLTTGRIQFSCHGSNYADAKHLARAVRVLFENFTGQLTDGTQVDSIHRVSEIDGFLDAPFSYVCHVDFEIAYRDIGT